MSNDANRKPRARRQWVEQVPDELVELPHLSVRGEGARELAKRLLSRPHCLQELPREIVDSASNVRSVTRRQYLPKLQEILNRTARGKGRKSDSDELRRIADLVWPWERTVEADNAATFREGVGTLLRITEQNGVWTQRWHNALRRAGISKEVLAELDRPELVARFVGATQSTYKSVDVAVNTFVAHQLHNRSGRPTTSREGAIVHRSVIPGPVVANVSAPIPSAAEGWKVARELLEKISPIRENFDRFGSMPSIEVWASIVDLLSVLPEFYGNWLRSVNQGPLAEKLDEHFFKLNREIKRCPNYQNLASNPEDIPQLFDDLASFLTISLTLTAADQNPLKTSGEAAGKPDGPATDGRFYCGGVPLRLQPLDAKLLTCIWSNGMEIEVERAADEVWGSDGASESALKNAKNRISKALQNVPYSIHVKAGRLKLERL